MLWSQMRCKSTNLDELYGVQSGEFDSKEHMMVKIGNNVALDCDKSPPQGTNNWT